MIPSLLLRGSGDVRADKRCTTPICPEADCRKALAHNDYESIFLALKYGTYVAPLEADKGRTLLCGGSKKWRRLRWVFHAATTYP